MTGTKWQTIGYQSWALVDGKGEILAEVREGRNGVYNFAMRSFISKESAQAAAELSIQGGQMS